VRRLAAALAGTVVLAWLPAVATPAAAAAPRLSGVLLNASGRPASVPLAIRVVKRLHITDPLEGFLLTIGGAAGVLACLGQRGLCVEPGDTIVRVGTGGRFSVNLPTGAGDYDLTVLSLAGSDAVARMSLTVDIGSSGLTLPALRLWDAAVRVRTSPGVVRFTWKPLPAGYSDTAVEYDLNAEPRLLGGFVGSPKRTATTATIDDRQLEDSPGVAVAVAKGRVRKWKVDWLTMPADYPAPAGRSLSRYRGCSIVLQGAKAAPFSPCWLVDGVTDDHYLVPRGTVCYRGKARASFPADIECGSRPVTAVTIDLGRARRIGEVRGIHCTRCLVDVSMDGVTWSKPKPTTDDSSAVVRFAAGTMGRYVRLRAAAPVVPSLETELSASGPIVGTVPYGVTPNDLGLQAEMSVWAPRPAPPPAVRLSPAPVAASPSLPTRRAHGDGVAVVPIVIAGGYIAGLLAALGYVARRRYGARRG